VSATIITLLASVYALAARVPPGTDAEIRARLEPAGKLCKAGTDCGAGVMVATTAAAGGGGAGLGLSGEEVYNKFCFACHAAGVGGAPKVHNIDEWAPRLAQDPDVLWQHTLNGINAMPPRGTCMACSDDELHAATKFMSSAAG
jgi:cytochrome c5